MNSIKAWLGSIEPLALMLRAFQYRNYRLFFAGQSISLVGTWMQQIAMSWLVYRLTGSAFLLGLVGFISQIPLFLVTPFAGVYADRWDRYRILIVTQVLSMAQAVVLTILFFTQAIAIWHIIGLSLFLGLVAAFDAPVRQAFVIELVENRKDLGNAIALNSLMFNGARLIGPFIAGILIAITGEGVCFLLNAASYCVVVVALLAMRIRKREKITSHPHMLRGLKEGVKYAFESSPIRSILTLLALVSLAGVPYAVLIPVVATKVLGGGAQLYGFLMASSGLGALIGAIYLATRKSVVGFGRKIAFAAATFGAALILFAISRSLPLSMPLMVIVGLGMMVQIASSNTVLQTIVEEDKRGRVMSLYTLAFMGVAPFGSLLAGSLATTIGAPATLAIGGMTCIIGSIFFAAQLPNIRKSIRPIYVRMGIISEVGSGIDSAAELVRPPEE